MSLAWPWSGRSHPTGNQWECWDPGQGSNVVGPPVLLPPNIWPTQSLRGWYLVTWLVGWPIAAGWVADCLSNKMSTWPSLPPNIWPAQSLTGWYLVMWLVGWPIAAGKLAGWLTAYHTKCWPDPSPKAETSCGHVCDYIGHIDLWSDVPPIESSSDQEWYYITSACHLVSLWVRLTCSQMYPPGKGIWWPRAVLHQVNLTFGQH